MNLSPYFKEYKTNFAIAIPVMLGQLGHVLVGFADNVMVGKLGATSLAAVSLANSIFFILMGLGLGFSFAITPLVAHAHGAKNFLQGKKDYQHGVLLLGFVGVVLALLLWWFTPFLWQLHQPKEVVQEAISYYKIIAISMVPMMVFQAMKQFTDGLGETKQAMWAIIIANVINVFLNYVLIYGHWGFPALGIDGAAIGTLVARVLMILVLFLFIRHNKSFALYNVPIIWYKFHKKIFIKIIKLGYPTALQMFFEIGIFATGVMFAGMLGTKVQAANQIVLNLATMTFMIATGMGVTATIRVGQQNGLQHFGDLKKIAFSIMLLMAMMATVFALFFITFRNVLPLIYIQDATVVKIATQLLIISALFQISDGLQVVILGALRGLQDMWIPMRLIFISYWLVGFPICYGLGLRTSLGIVGVWIGLLAGLTCAAILLYCRFSYLLKKLIIKT